MKRLTVLLTLAILVAGLVLLGLSDTVISLPDTSLSPNEVTSNVSKVSNSSATATITITMYTLPND
jgi:hypothetical protein